MQALGQNRGVAVGDAISQAHCTSQLTCQSGVQKPLGGQKLERLPSLFWRSPIALGDSVRSDIDTFLDRQEEIEHRQIAFLFFFEKCVG